MGVRSRSRFRVRWAGLAVAIGLAGCASVPDTDPVSRYFRFPAATRLVLEQPLEIPADSAHVTLQDGQPVTLGRLRRYEPFCELEVNAVRATAQTVRPDTFAVTDIVRQQQSAAPSVLRLAGISFGFGVGSGGFGFGIGFPFGVDRDDRWAMLLSEVRFRLRSPAQPDVRELRCTAGWAYASHAQFPTLAEMQRALGALARIELP